MFLLLSQKYISLINIKFLNLSFLLSNIMENQKYLLPKQKDQGMSDYQNNLDVKGKPPNLNHVSMSSIEPASLHTQAQSRTKMGPQGEYEDIKKSAVQQVPTTVNSKLEMKQMNQATDSMVFLKSPANVANNVVVGAALVPNLNGEHFLGFKGNKAGIEHAEKNQPEMQKEKRGGLKKNAFESELQQTGRFEASPNAAPAKVSKTVQNSKLGSIMNDNSQDSPDVQIQDFDRLGIQAHYENPSTQENEMRETSYFKQQTDDEGSPCKLDQKSLGQLLSLSKQQLKSVKQSQSKKSDLLPKEAASTRASGAAQSGQILQSSGEETVAKPSKKSRNHGEAQSQKQESAREAQKMQQDGIQMFKMSSRSQMKHRAQKNNKKLNIEQNMPEEDGQFTPSSRPQQISSQLSSSLATPKAEGDKQVAKKQNLSYQNRKVEETTPQETEEFPSLSLFLNGRSISQLNSNNQEEYQQLQIEDDSPGLPEEETFDREMRVLQHNIDQSPAGEADSPLEHNGVVHEQNQKQQLKIVNATGNFGALSIQKQQSGAEHHNYSVLKGAIPSKVDQMMDNESELPPNQQQMFTSMSDIGFPNNIHSKGKKPGLKQRQTNKGELITPEQIQRMMDTQNNWRVRTKTIDEILHDIQDRIETDPEYVMSKSEKLVDFFLQLLTDQNFKIVLNTLNILNMILGMPEQCQRYVKIMQNEMPADQRWGLSNAILGRHIPQIVKKLADSKNIIRQEAIRCLSYMNEIMRSGNKKDNNFIALILPYLNNSSNWHIREELLNLLIKCFLHSQDQNEFDSYQILDSVLQLFNDTKEKIRNLALEAIAAFASIGEPSKLNEILFQLNVDKEIVELIQSRLEYGMFPSINQEGNVEIPYQDQFQNFDVDSVAHSMANQSQVVSQFSHDNPRRKQSLGGGSQVSYQGSKGRGNSSGRKIVVATANATNQQLGVSHHDEIIQQAYINSKRTASANNPNQLDFDHSNLNQNEQNFISEQNHLENQGGSFSYSVGGGKAGGNKQQRERLLDELGIQQDLNGSSFLPSLQRQYTDQNGNQQNNQYQSQQQNRDRIIGSSGGLGMGYIGGIAQGNIDPNLIVGQAGGGQHLMSGGTKRSNKYLHGTPGHPSNYQAHFSQIGTNLQTQFNRGNSGKVTANHNMNNSISNKSPSMFDQNTLFDMSGHVASLFGNEIKNGSNNFEQMHRANINQQMSDMGLHEHHEILSSGGMNNSHFHQQTPSSQFGHDPSMGYHGDAYAPGMPDGGDFTTLGMVPGNMAGGVPMMGVSPSPHGEQQQLFVHEGRRHVAQGHKSSISGQPAQHVPKPQPNFSVSQNNGSVLNAQYQDEMNVQKVSGKNSRASNRHQREISGAQQQQMGVLPISNKKHNQNTFYSDGTTFTGITTTTGATSQNRGANQKQRITMIKGSAQNQGVAPTTQILDDGSDFRQHVINAGGAGPIKATRAALGGMPQQEDRQELCIDNRKSKSSSVNPTAKVKISTKMQGSAQGIKQLKRDESNDSDRMFESATTQNRSFSHTKNHSNNQSKQELQSAGIPLRQGYLGGEAIGEFATGESGEDPALLTQSSKIQYVESDQLEPLEKPEKEYKKSLSKNQGIYSEDWFDQFEACNVIRRVCKHHQSIILQTGNSLQSLVGTLSKHADSLRSAVSRIALMTFADMFQTLKRVMEPCLVSIVKTLIKRASDTNHFIAEEADKCLAIMAQNCQESKVLQVLQMQNMNSRSNLQRLKVCQCLTLIVKQLDNNILFFKENDKLLVQLAKYLQDASQDVRQQAKTAFVAMSQAIMGQNELAKLLQRVLNEVQYKKVRDVLDREPTQMDNNQGQKIDFVITNAKNKAQGVQKKQIQNQSNKQSFKSLRHNGGFQKQNAAVAGDQDDPLSIQATSIVNPQLAKQESSGFLNKIAQQNKPSNGAKREEFHQHDQFFVDTMKDLILRSQVNEWRLRLESTEQLFDLLRSNSEYVSKNHKSIELADALCKLLNDQNAKIQLCALDNFNKVYPIIQQYVEKHMHLFSKSITKNQGSSNPGVRNISEQILRQLK